MTDLTMTNQTAIDRKNSEFWNELCGSQLARQLGVTDNSPASLKKFDDWYFDFYPYLYSHIPFAKMRSKQVLEIGLGYGTVSQKIAEAGALYHGLDIAAGPVAMVAERCRTVGANTAVVKQGSILEAPFETGTFDWVVAIGCLHHTGNLAKAVQEVYRVLKPDGQASIMVYSASSYRQYSTMPWLTFKRHLAGGPYRAPTAQEWERGAYDRGLNGTAAPQTEFVTKRELIQLCRDFARVRVRSENIGAEGMLAKLQRRTACNLFGSTLGLDLYAHLDKSGRSRDRDSSPG